MFNAIALTASITVADIQKSMLVHDKQISAGRYCPAEWFGSSVGRALGAVGTQAVVGHRPIL